MSPRAEGAPIAAGAGANGGDVLLEVRHLVKHFNVSSGMFGSRAGTVRAVDGVSFTLKRGETPWFCQLVSVQLLPMCYLKSGSMTC